MSQGGVAGVKVGAKIHSWEKIVETRDEKLRKIVLTCPLDVDVPTKVHDIHIFNPKITISSQK